MVRAFLPEEEFLRHMSVATMAAVMTPAANAMAGAPQAPGTAAAAVSSAPTTSSAGGGSALDKSAITTSLHNEEHVSISGTTQRYMMMQKLSRNVVRLGEQGNSPAPSILTILSPCTNLHAGSFRPWCC